jgi:hypothetical protein
MRTGPFDMSQCALRFDAFDVLTLKTKKYFVSG